jgi:hypothetical protein
LNIFVPYHFPIASSISAGRLICILVSYPWAWEEKAVSCGRLARKSTFCTIYRRTEIVSIYEKYALWLFRHVLFGTAAPEAVAFIYVQMRWMLVCRFLPLTTIYDMPARGTFQDLISRGLFQLASTVEPQHRYLRAPEHLKSKVPQSTK